MGVKEASISTLTPGPDDLWFIPLGGTGEIGMNMNLYGHNGQWLMVDCGVSFDEPLVPPYQDTSPSARFDIVAPDPSFIAQQKEKLCGMVITHGHEDHVGAVPYLWPRLRCPVYTTAFTAEILQRKLAQTGLKDKVPIIIVDALSEHQVGPFSLNWLAVTHSIPEPYALKISTPAGSVLHTADWKIDAQPVTGKPFDATLYRQLGSENILAMVGDSTNATKPGFSVSERNCFDGLLATIRPLEGRVVVSCFGSNVARLISLAHIAVKTGRYMALYGRSLLNMYSIARRLDVWPDHLKLIDPDHAGYLPPAEVLAVATGSQGEQRAALARMARDDHHQLSLDKGDTVIFSSIVIPGNEQLVGALISQLNGLGITTITSEDSQLPIHASGHPCAEELKLMYSWVKPQIAIPVHGEPEHLDAHGQVAKSAGVRKRYVGRNGDLYRLAPVTGIRRQVVRTGRVPVKA
ncbi:ribonuclease J [Salinimonas sp. HHU 13199]|uniref:Ribonuclease J n=1 Tax=Salinimonas profundi TaxID=2729140 RepID=A0ABR8LJH0_9ALTE|nr:ribonuclease J [Salinimonas profundi]MBD3584224.1 ribonuclease J [Salinimonas profundi]